MSRNLAVVPVSEGSGWFAVLMTSTSLRIPFCLLYFAFSNAVLFPLPFLLQDPSKDPWAEAQNRVKSPKQLMDRKFSFQGGKYSFGFTWGGSGYSETLDIAVQFHRSLFFSNAVFEEK